MDRILKQILRIGNVDGCFKSPLPLCVHTFGRRVYTMYFIIIMFSLLFSNHTFLCFRGLVLQDLTFVHIGNSDFLSDGVINFSKRWQQFNIVENMKRFKKGLVLYTYFLNIEILFLNVTLYDIYFIFVVEKLLIIL